MQPISPWKPNAGSLTEQTRTGLDDLHFWPLRGSGHIRKVTGPKVLPSSSLITPCAQLLFISVVIKDQMDQDLLCWQLIYGIPENAFNSLYSILSAYGVVAGVPGNENLSVAALPIISRPFQTDQSFLDGSLINTNSGSYLGTDDGSIFPSMPPSGVPQPVHACEDLRISATESFSQSQGLLRSSSPFSLAAELIERFNSEGILWPKARKEKTRSCIKCRMLKKKVCFGHSYQLIH